MIINIDKIKINLELFREENKTAKPFLVFLHGFTGSSQDWIPVIPKINNNFPAAAIDLIGHGRSSSPSELTNYSEKAVVAHIYEAVKKITEKEIILIGYSMGGRAALSFAVKYGELIKGLILESSAAGIDDKILRSERIKKDEELADFILSNSIENFVDYWMNLEIFSTQKFLSNEKLKKIKENKSKNNKIGLANSLRGFGTGRMSPLFKRLKDIGAETLLITGESDQKFNQLNSVMLKLFEKAEHKIIKNSGHNVHLGEPEVFAETVNSFLMKLSFK
jgi:2-succinyl-6-hydroxy-2,4-cyclohexadiene-1-carboxylate synthase